MWAEKAEEKSPPFASQKMGHPAGRKDDYEVESDFLCEVFLVNETDNPVTIKRIFCEAQLGQEKKVLPPIADLTDYQIEPVNAATSAAERFRMSVPNKDLTSLNKILDGQVITRGFGYRGWLRFGIVTQKSNLDKPVMTELWIVDALGGKHGVSADEPFDTSEGMLVHNSKKAFD
jgi:hypothetical protein